MRRINKINNMIIVIPNAVYIHVSWVIISLRDAKKRFIRLVKLFVHVRFLAQFIHYGKRNPLDSARVILHPYAYDSNSL